MKKHWSRISLSILIGLAIVVELVSRQLYDPHREVYENEPAYNLHSIAMFVGSICIAMSIRIGHPSRVVALIWAASTFFDMLKELTSLNNQNDVIQWVLYWFVVSLTTVYGITEHRHSHKRNY
jgi:surface polysaccharide O-acyltransferase-like enzyme